LLGIAPGKSFLDSGFDGDTRSGLRCRVFFARYASPGLAGIFDGGLFSKRLGEVLVSLFIEMAVITGLGIIVVVFFFFLDWRLPHYLAPVAFALVCTLGP